MSEAIIGSLAPWYGAKRSMAAEIVREIGPHGVYWEPFCGSMAVLLSKPPCRTEVVNDLHGDLVNLARCIQHPIEGPRLYRRLRRVLVSQALFEESREAANREWAPSASPDPDRAFHYFVMSWLGMNGVAGTPMHHLHFARRFSSKGGGPAERWRGAVASIPAWRRRLERVQVLSSDGIELCEKVEDVDGVVIYCDPPYLVKGASYVHDFEAEDHARLAVALRRFERTRVVVSYYDHPRLADLYPGWTVRRIEVTKALVNQGKRDSGGVTKAPEVLLVNRPAESAPGFAFLDGDPDA